MRALVTGASGAFGAHMAARLLADGHEVMSIRHDEHPCDTASLLGIRDRVAWARGSILDESFCKRLIADFVPDAVYHFAALPLVQTGTRTATPIFTTNVLGTIHLLEAIKENAWAGRMIRFLAVATDKVYGDAGREPYRETMPLGGLAVYDVSKACADMIARTYAACGFVPSLAVVRPCNILAPGDLNLGRVLPRLVLPCLRGERPTLYRNDGYRREFIAVEDAIDGILALDRLLVEKPADAHGQAFNVGSGEQRSLAEVVAAVLAHFPGIDPVWIDPPKVARVEIPYQALDSAKIRLATGWAASCRFEETVSRLVAWWREHWTHLPEGLRSYRVRDWHG